MGILEELTVERDRTNSYPEEDIEILDKHTDVNTDGIKGYKIGVFDGYNKVAQIEYYVFEASSTGYIGWLHVDKEWRRQGIAREVRRQAIEHMLKIEVNEIWSGPVSDIIKPLVRDQGFEPASQMEKFSDYYVYKR